MHDHDVIIIGSGIAGGILGSILARNGADVLILDGAQHPRFAVGESTVPHLLARLNGLSVRYDVPEISHLQDIRTLTKEIGTSHGVKKHFGFQIHSEGAEPDFRQSVQAAIPKTLYRAGHLFRQDTDAYLFQVAVRYGATARQGFRVADVEIDDDGVTVIGQTGERLRGRYLVDAGGFRSVLADKLGLREQPTHVKHHSRSLFTHMIDVKRYDDVVDTPRRYQPPAPWYQGTMHHVFDRGWFWVIPFNNHKDSTNNLISVGLTLDERVYPKPRDKTAEQEFFEFVAKFPAVARQFEGARAAREWVSTDRMQYSSTRSTGARWCLMSHAAGFIDPLWSRGISNTVEVIDALAWRVLEALKTDDFTEERFEYVSKLERGLLDYNDDLTNCSLISFANFRLWDAIFRIWGFSSNYGAMRLTRAELQYDLTKDDQVFRDLEKAENTGFWWPDEPEMKRIWDLMVETCLKAEAGAMGYDEAADILHRELAASDLPPAALGYKDPDNQWINPSVLDLARFLRWSIKNGRPTVHDLASGLLRASLRKGIRRQKVV